MSKRGKIDHIVVQHAESSVKWVKSLGLFSVLNRCHKYNRKGPLMSSKHWMYIGCGVIAVSNILQAIGGFSPTLSGLSIAGVIINTISIPLTIIQSQKSGLESQQQLSEERQRNWEMSEPGRAHIAKMKIRHDMEKGLSQ